MKAMRKQLLGLAVTAAAAMGLASCSNDMEPNTPQNEGMVDVTMTTSLPEGIRTYATTSSSSALGGLENLAGKGYHVRYIMEVYPETSDEPVKRVIKYNELTTADEVRNVTFETRLLAAKYRFVFYADIVRDVNLGGGISDGLDAACRGNHYFLSNISDDKEMATLYRPGYYEEAVEGNLQTIMPAYQAANMPWGHTSLEQYDVYTANGAVDLRNETTGSFTLKRPFAKLRVITTDADDALLPKINWEKSVVSLSAADDKTVLNNTYNALTGDVSLNGRGYYVPVYKTTTAETDEYADETAGEKTLGVFYIPASNNKSFNLSFNVTVKSGNTTVVDNAPYQVDNVPLAANKLTTIKGKLLTKKVVNEITIADGFETPAPDDIIIGKEAATVEELKSALSGKTEIITYTGKITKADGFTINFDEIEAKEAISYAAANPMYADGNEAYLTINFTSVEEGAVLTFIGANGPQKFQIQTPTKCSLRIDMENTKIYYDGLLYKYIVANAGCLYHKSGSQFDAFFAAKDWYMPNNPSASHQLNVNSDFTLPDDLKCQFAKGHTNKTCTFIADVKNWLEANPGKTVWDFVEANK